MPKPNDNEKFLENEYYILLKQRDELLAACRQALLTGFCGSDSESIEKAVNMIHLAISHAERK